MASLSFKYKETKKFFFPFTLANKKEILDISHMHTLRGQQLSGRKGQPQIHRFKIV